MRALTDRYSGGQSDPVAPVVGAHQLLPHEEDWSHVQGIRHKLMYDHEYDGHIPGSTHRHYTIHIACITRVHKLYEWLVVTMIPALRS